MSKTVWRVTPVNGYDIPGLEGWLEKQAAKGLVFSMTVGPFTLFRRVEPAALRFHLEPSPDKPDRTDPELNALYEEAGWRYLGLFRSSFAVFATEGLESQAHTDPEVWSYVLGRFFRRKLLAGLGLLALNFLCLESFRFLVELSWSDLRWFPVDTMSTHPLLPSILSAVGVVLVDLSWLLGLLSLDRYRKAVISREKPPRHTHGGGLLAVGVLALALVLADLMWQIADVRYQPILEEAGAVTLADIEGEDFLLAWDTDPLPSMDYSSHRAGLLMPQRWRYWQSGRFRWVDGVPEEAPKLYVEIYRYHLPWLAGKMVEEQGRIQWNGGKYKALSPAQGLDQALISHDAFDPERDAYPGTRLVLRRGNVVLLVEYQGNQELVQSLPQFARMLERL